MAVDKKMKQGELSAFCDQVAMILDAGIPLYDGLETLSENNRAESECADMYDTLSRNMNETGSLYEAFRKDSRWPDYLSEMAGIGERSGHLPDVMRSLSAFYEREGRIRDAVINAVTYPMVIGCILVVIVAVMLWRVLPVFRQVLVGMGISMSGSAGRLMRLGSAIGWVVLVLMVLFILFALVCALLWRSGAREKVSRLLYRLFPPMMRLRRKLCAARTASVLSMMLSSGFPVAEALSMTGMILTDEECRRQVDSVREDMENGSSFSDAIGRITFFDSLHLRMIRTGITAGQEDKVMEKIAETYENQAEDSIARLISIIEPTLVAVLAVVVGAVLLSVMLPMTGVLRSVI